MPTDLEIAIVSSRADDASGCPRSRQILVAEDNPVFQTMLRNMLHRWGYDVIVARDGDAAWNALQSDAAPRLAILDWMMPGMDGVEVCRKVRAANREPYIYILLLSARTESDDLVEGMEAGADDYLKKPVNAHELRVRLRAGTRILDLQQELLEAREALRELATRDSLTGLLNRRTILTTLENELSRAGREKLPLSLLMVDLDRFKLINDTYGDLAGDTVLRETASRMKSAVRCYDSVGRYGGEEFLIVIPGCHGAAAEAQANRIREALAAAPVRFGMQSFRLTCSIGMAQRAIATTADAEALVREADLALYVAKDRGRNCVQVYQSSFAAV